MRLRGFLAGVPTRFLVLAALLALFLSGTSYITATEQLEEAHNCRTDWRDAIEARASGAAEFSANCASFGGFSDNSEVPTDFYAQLDEWENRFDEELSRIARDPWRLSGSAVAGLPLVVVALLLGSLGVGSPLGSGTAAWSLSNGWTRKSWLASGVAVVLLLIVIAYVVLVGLFIVLLTGRINGVGATLPLSPSTSLFLPIPGLLFYGIIGLALGVAFRKAETAAIAAAVVGVLDLMMGKALSNIHVIPSTLHSIALGLVESDISTELAAGSLLIGVMVLTGLTYQWMTRVVNIPDRPT